MAGSTQCMACLSLHGCSHFKAGINLHGCYVMDSDQMLHGCPHKDMDRSTMQVLVNSKVDNQCLVDFPSIRDLSSPSLILKSQINLGGSRFLKDLQDYSSTNIVEQINEEECIPYKDLRISSILFVLESMHTVSELAYGIEREGSMKNVLSLANCNDCLNDSIEVCSSDFDILPLRYTIQTSTRQCKDASTFKVRKRCRCNIHDSLWNIMGQGKPSQAECSIHNSDIENRNRVILWLAEQMVQQCNDMIISFYEERENILSLALCILKK